MMIAPFCLDATALEPGLTLIEASAGTGKTYTIAGIVLRLVLEADMPLQEILVVTYTVAATQELRDRVRRRLRDALEDLRSGQSEDELVRKFLPADSLEKAIRALNLAVQSFDEAQIFTIHGFCQRVLKNHAFASGILFEMELLADPADILEEVALDFWRRRFYASPSQLLPRLALAHGRSPAGWSTLLKVIGQHPDLTVLPAEDPDSCEALVEKLETFFALLADQWRLEKTGISELLGPGALSQNKDGHFGPVALPKHLANLDSLFSCMEEACTECLLSIPAFSSSEIAAAVLKKKVAPTHPFFDRCQEFSELTTRLLHQLNGEFIAFAKCELPQRKERLNVLTYDDLLIRLRNALQGPNGNAFASALGGKYRAALIDEFQDTDPIQYDIFSRLFTGSAHYLYFIGDPKQAIYGFRGADVFTYLRASQAALRAYTLGTNFRSEPLLLDAVNVVFENVAQPFLIEEIAYRPVKPPLTPRENFSLLQTDSPQPPLQFRFLEKPDPGGRPVNQATAESLISRAVVADIERLKESGARIGERPLSLRDMAVLVRSNRQASDLQDLLRERGIKSVLQTDASVFEADEACELLRLLEAVLEPGRDVLLKTGLTTSFIGLDAAELLAFDSAQAQWQRWLDLFLAYRQLWEKSCFIALFRHLLVDQKVRERLVQQRGGERRLTNFLHLSELLHQAETDLRLTPEALCTWLRKQRANPAKGMENHQLRLESDEDAVLLATVHKSKGLEYPIVFCPFLWKPGDKHDRTELLFHDPAHDHRMTLDLRRADEMIEHDLLTAAERNAEALRVLYVALTRAQNRCHVYVGDISNFEKSPLGHLISPSGPLGPFSALQALVAKAPRAIALSLIEADRSPAPRPASPAADNGFPAREFTGHIPPAQIITSFSGLISGALAEEPDRDALGSVVPQPEADGALSALANFERGIRAGLFLHDVLEKLDFQTPAQLEKLVPQQLLAHGIPFGNWPETLMRELKAMLDVPLMPDLVPGLALNKIGLRDRLSEVEFSHPILPIRPAELEQLFHQHGGPGIPAEFPPSLGRLQFRPMDGYMRGFIDLLFVFEGRYYLLDWKSNWLGSRIAHYDLPGMRASMLHHSYYLQYHLYTLATDLFLNQRLPDYDYNKHFGGVLYLFVRGIDKRQPGSGIFYDRPDSKLIRALRDRMVGPAS